MTTYQGHEGAVYSGSAQIAEVVSWNYTETAGTTDFTNQAATHEIKKVGLKSTSGSVNCFYVDNDTTGQDTLSIGSVVSLVLYPEGNTTGKERVTISAIVTSKAVDSPAGMGAVTKNFSWEAASAPVYSTII